jgi:thiamine biosynthesis lipoprotein
MATQKWKQVGGAIITLVWMTQSTSAQSHERFSFAEPHLGTIVEFTIYAPEETVANDAARSGFARVKQLDLIFSDYKPESEVMQLCRTAGSGRPTKVSPELFQCLKLSMAISEKSEGAFDVTIGPLIKLWRRARKEKKLPAADEISAAKELVGWKLVLLNEADQTVELTRAGMQLDFGGIAKGFIADKVSQLLRERGLKQTLIAVAGDIVAGDSPPMSDGWKIGVGSLQTAKRVSTHLLLLKNGAVSTSGDAFQFVEIAGVRYSHIVDPQTGIGLTRRSTVTVVTNSGASADGLATAISVLGPERGLRLIDENEKADALIVQAVEQRVEVFESKGFRNREVK